MRRIKIMGHVSLDGVMQHDTDACFAHGNWPAPYRTPAGLEAQDSQSNLLLGRRTYDAWADCWPQAGGNPMANRLNAATKYVVTHRSDSLAWGLVQGLGADIVVGFRTLRATAGPDPLVGGSSTLASILLSQGFIDEVILVIYPVLPGRGKRFFSADAAPRKLAFVSSQPTPYRPAAQHVSVCGHPVSLGPLAWF